MAGSVVAVIQSIANPGDLDQSVQDHVRLAEAAARQGARIALFPELSLTGYSYSLTRADSVATSDPRVRSLQAVADAHDILIIAGAPIASPWGLHIGALCFIPRRGVSTYTKQYLHEGEETAFVAGEGGDAIRVDNQLVCLAICAEITHADHAREASDNGAHVYAASCFITPSGYAYDAGILQRYAREHGFMVLMANYGAPTGGWQSAGRSAIWSATGELLACAPGEGEAVIVANVARDSEVEAAVTQRTGPR
jgi:predicted amidohydrolase